MCHFLNGDRGDGDGVEGKQEGGKRRGGMGNCNWEVNKIKSFKKEGKSFFDER